MSLPIFDGQDLVAAIETDQGALSLRYDEAWRAADRAFPISLTMPLDQIEHAPDVVVPWLMNLLPEGEPLRAMTRAIGVSQDDILGLLAETGRARRPVVVGRRWR